MNDGTIPCSVQNRGNRRFHAAFSPTECIPHYIQMRFQGKDVPGTCESCGGVVLEVFLFRESFDAPMHNDHEYYIVILVIHCIGSPWTVDVRGITKFNVSGPGLDVVPIGRQTHFEARASGSGELASHILTANITGEYRKITSLSVICDINSHLLYDAFPL